MQILYAKKGKTQGHLREIMVEDYRKSGSSIKTGEKYQISHTTVLKRSGEESLENKSSAPKVPHRTNSLEVIYLTYYLYEKEGLNGEKIQEYFEKNDVLLARSSMYYYLKECGCIQRRKEQGKRENKKFKEYEPGYVHIDITYGPKINGIKYYIHVAIDRATRLIYLKITDNKRAETASEFLKEVVEFFPFTIKKILTDNGKEYTLKNHRGNKDADLQGAFDVVCKAYDIEHRLTAPHTPQTNGMAEKCNDTIKSNTVKQNTYADGGEMYRDIARFMLYYILERRHGGLKKDLGVKTPMEALEYRHNLMPELFKETLVDFRAKLDKIRLNL